MSANVATRDELQWWRRCARVLTVALAITGFLLLNLVTLIGEARRARANCQPVALAVVPGDTVAGDVAYVLDSCGRTTRQPLARVAR